MDKMECSNCGNDLNTSDIVCRCGVKTIVKKFDEPVHSSDCDVDVTSRDASGTLVSESRTRKSGNISATVYSKLNSDTVMKAVRSMVQADEVDEEKAVQAFVRALNAKYKTNYVVKEKPAKDKSKFPDRVMQSPDNKADTVDVEVTHLDPEAIKFLRKLGEFASEMPSRKIFEKIDEAIKRKSKKYAPAVVSSTYLILEIPLALGTKLKNEILRESICIHGFKSVWISSLGEDPFEIGFPFSER